MITAFNTTSPTSRSFAAYVDPAACYDAGHSLNSGARSDRVQWLVERLGLKSVTESALSEIPDLK
jgi:hypothetical protein